MPVLRAWQDRSISHGFLSRVGGISRGRYATLNLSDRIRDDAAAVRENWRRVVSLFPAGSSVARLNQVHGTKVHSVTRGESAIRSTADAMVTREAGVVLGVMTADCVPVLLLDSRSHVVGAVHAGWRGVIAGLSAATVEGMVKLGTDPKNIRAALGPSIGPCCFEIDLDLAERFAREIPGSDRHASPGPSGKAYLDLRAVVGEELARAGVTRSEIQSVGPCTKCASDRYFSRRAAGGSITGLQMSFVGFDR